MAHETSDTFSNETLCEQITFQHAKEAEMKEMLTNLADGQIELYRNVSDISPSWQIFLLIVLGHGRMGQDCSDYPAHTRGRLAHFALHIPI
jgi:hypothetical protein